MNRNAATYKHTEDCKGNVFKHTHNRTAGVCILQQYSQQITGERREKDKENGSALDQEKKKVKELILRRQYTVQCKPRRRRRRAVKSGLVWSVIKR